MSDGSEATSKKNPVAVFIGLALVGGLALLGVTREQWLTQLTGEKPAATTTEEPATTTAEQPAATTTEQAATTTTEQPATTTAEQPAATTTEQAATTTAEQPATTTAEQPAATTTEQAVTTTTEQPATTAEGVKIVPTFDTVRIEKSGEAVIAGRAEPGANVTVKLGGAVIGSATANADGSFVVVPEQALPAGSGALTIEAKAGDAAPVTSEQSVAVIVPENGKDQSLVAVVSPNEPTKVLQKPEASTSEAAPAAGETTELASAPAQISIDSVDYDESGNIVFSGSGAPGSAARIYVDNALAGEVKAGDDGRWTFSGTQITTGTHTLRADAITADGSVASRAEVPFFREERSKVATADTGATTTEQAADAGQAATTDTGAATTDEGAATTTADAGATTTTESATTTTADSGATTTADSGTTTTADAGATTTADTGAATTTEQATTTTAEATGPKEGRIVIQPGNNLWRISRVIYGTGMKYTVLYDANREQIRDPDLIYPGQVFKTPDVVPPETIDPKRRQPLTAEEGAANP
ncbi:MAG: LysM peptidoglycan-binding domain-containing protein [Alphaproteobacteria bacterium]|nr:LysM peptidoglycan-binding domain-containing protein [Alphaproteobacteria bacterium]